MLTERLRELEAAGIVLRQVETGPPISVSYALVDQAGELTVALRALRAWAATRSRPSQSMSMRGR
jgi:DNA-binding HxlR family transcriptional regulator